MAEPGRAVRQLPLALPPRTLLIEADFLPSAGNARARRFLADAGAWPQGRLALWGGRGCGKTHLLHIWAQRTSATLLQGASLREPVWPAGPVAVDDADRAAEPALLHLLNGAAEAGHALLLTTSGPPARLPVGLPDLASRLRATAAVEIEPADEALLAALLARLLADRQLAVAPRLQAWMLARLPRTATAMQEACARLDRAALAANCAVTPALARTALAELFDDPASAASPADGSFG